MLAICSPESRQVVESATAKWSLEVGWCSSLQEARRSLRRGTHPLVLCEAKLPDGTYQDVVQLLQHKLNRTRVIVMSESEPEECYNEAMALGVFDVIATPCRRTDVQWIIMRAVQGHPQRQPAEAESNQEEPKPGGLNLDGPKSDGPKLNGS
jgi:two-component system response regulator PilR (NtrC family)